MKRTKKCEDTRVKINVREKLDTKRRNKRCPSAGIFCTSSAGAVISLILMLTLSLTSAFCFNLLSNNAAYAYQISMDYSGAQSIDVALDGSGMGTSIAKDDISITTTCPTGYNLSISTSVNDNNLYLDGSSSNNQSGKYFSPVDGVNSLASNTNKWGYYFNSNSATAPTSDSVFAAVPTPASPAIIKTPSTSTTSDSFSLYYGVSINSGLAAGTYKMVKESGSSTNDGTIVYYLTMDEACNYAGYMQDMTDEDLDELMPNEGDTVRLADKRDDNTYDVTRINGQFWMTQNLRYLGDTGSAAKTMTIGNNNSNVSNKDITLYSLDSSSAGNFNPYSGRCDSTNGYNNACVYDSGSETTGVWYNYYAASGGTISTNNNQTAATNDICPSGWHLPSGPNTTSGTDYNKLIGNTTSGWQNPTAGLTSFGAVAGGYYSNGSLIDTGRSIWWSATAFNATYRYYLLYNSSGGQFNGDGDYRRYNGVFVRCVKKVPTLYDSVAKQSKGKQSVSDLQATITKDNSGVYEYDDSSSAFGPATDGGSDYPIYYYRGILDNTTGTYGSNGDNAAYPNTVVLSTASSKSGLTTSDTCWRIVRTTGSGGTKMIYQGKWTGSTCANAQTSAQTTTKAFDTTANSNGKSIVGVGYTYNASYKSTTTSTQAGTLFGTNSSYSGNTTNSTMKSYLGGTGSSNFWDTISSYESKLEPSAGYCNDRSVNSGTSWTTYSDTTSITTPSSGSSATTFFFGAYQRNLSTPQTPTLGCPRSTVDLYTTSSASNGNKQLGKPVALLTADEASFAGSGSQTASQGSSYNANSFLRSGSDFYLLSPHRRFSNGRAYGFALRSYGYLGLNYVSSAYGVRPAISLTSGTTPASGTGTAADPWIVNP